jgi:hypothetical protein
MRDCSREECTELVAAVALDNVGDCFVIQPKTCVIHFSHKPKNFKHERYTFFEKGQQTNSHVNLKRLKRRLICNSPWQLSDMYHRLINSYIFC